MDDTAADSTGRSETTRRRDAGGRPADAGPGYPEHWEADVLLRDGGIARVRPITPGDAERLVQFYAAVSDESKYYRFFAPYPRLSDRDVRRFTHHDHVNRVGLAAVVRDRFIATVRYDRIDTAGHPAGAGSGATAAEVAFLVEDAHQGRGVASALLEHIAAVARERGIRRFHAEVLPGNRKMIKVFTDAGYTQRRSFADGVVHLELDLEPTDASLAVMRAREHRAEARSVQRLLAPRVVAVVGAGRDPNGVGRTVLRNLLAAGFPGTVHAVNRAAPPGTVLDGVPVHRSVREIPGPVDLAVVAVPAAAVPAVVADCDARGVRGLVVVTAGYAETGAEGRQRQRSLVRTARTAGMRLVGPNALGIVNTSSDVRLNASLAPVLPRPGRVGMFTQSGAIGVALLDAAHRRGLGVSSFVSAGNRADVSGNDLLQYWEEDPGTDLVLLYLESFGNPRKFTRLARRIAPHKPVVVVKGGRHTGSVPPGHAVPPTSSRLRDATVDALFQQAGVLRVETVTDLFDTAELLTLQPLPPGDRVAIVGNSDSMGLLTHDACLAAGLHPREPVDLTTAATGEHFRAALTGAVADPSVDAVVAVVIPPIGVPAFPGSTLLDVAGARDTATSDAPALAAALADVAGRATEAGKPLLLTHLALDGLAARLRRRGPAGALLAGSVPAYPAPERAVRALAHAVRYAGWRRTAAADDGRVPELARVDETAARVRIHAALAPRRAAGDGAGRLAEPVVLTEDETVELLGDYGIDVFPARPVTDEDSAARAAADLGYPVALKASAGHLRHRPDLGGVRLNLGGEAELRRAHREMCARLGGHAGAHLVIQHMAPRGVDTVVTATVDPAAGAILSFGIAGPPAELLGDVAHRLVPATDRDVAGLVRAVRAAPLLFGWRGAAPVDTDALEDVLLRVSRLVDDLPEVVSVELEPVVVAPRGLSVLGAAVRVGDLPPRTDLGPRSMSSL